MIASMNKDVIARIVEIAGRVYGRGASWLRIPQRPFFNNKLFKTGRFERAQDRIRPEEEEEEEVFGSWVLEERREGNQEKVDPAQSY